MSISIKDAINATSVEMEVEKKLALFAYQIAMQDRFDVMAMLQARGYPEAAKIILESTPDFAE